MQIGTKVLVMLLFLAAAGYAGETRYVWWEAEKATETNLTTKGGYHYLNAEQSARLSGNQWLNGKGAKNGMFAEYEVKVPSLDAYVLYVRKFWKHGTFRWRFDNKSWRTLGHEQEVLDSVGIVEYVPACWVRLGKLTLTSGTHKFRVELLNDPSYKHNGNFGLDCFLLVNREIKPKGLTRPDECETGEAPTSKKKGHSRADVKLRNPETFGRSIARTMALLESSSPENRVPVNILFYGQSIVGSGHPSRIVGKYLRKKYPHAKLTIKNKAIGGYQAPKLIKTSFHDLYPEYPDLVVFHVYGGEKGGEYEAILRNIRTYTTAEVLTWTHHVDACKQGKYRDSASTLRRQLATKYDCELAEVRERWKEHLDRVKAAPKSLLRDNIHPNGGGGHLLGSLLTPHFRPQPVPSSRREWVRTYSLDKDHSNITFEGDTWKRQDGGLISTTPGKPLRITFTGNRVDLVALKTGGTAKILLDGKAPSQHPDTYAATRTNKVPYAWWPTINRIEWGKNAVAETWTLTYKDIAKNGSSFKFDLVGSVTGPDGGGQSGVDFVSNSKRISFKEDNTFRGVNRYLKKQLPQTHKAKWKTYSMSRDRWKGPSTTKPGQIPRTKVLQFWTSGTHTLEIVPEAGSTVALESIVVHTPPLANK